MILLTLKSSVSWNIADTLGKSAPFLFNCFTADVKAMVLYSGESLLAGEVCLRNDCTVRLYELIIMITIISSVLSTIICDY